MSHSLVQGSLASSLGALKNPAVHAHTAAPVELAVLLSGQAEQEKLPILLLNVPTPQTANKKMIIIIISYMILVSK